MPRRKKQPQEETPERAPEEITIILSGPWLDDMEEILQAEGVPITLETRSAYIEYRLSQFLERSITALEMRGEIEKLQQQLDTAKMNEREAWQELKAYLLRYLTEMEADHRERLSA
jgi:hypothetical protein